MSRTERYAGWQGALGNRKAVVGLVPVIREVLAGQGRAVGPRRITYLLLDVFQHDPTVAGLIELGRTRFDDPKRMLDERVVDTVAVMRDVGLLHPDQVSDGRSTTEVPVTYTGQGAWVQWARGQAEGYRRDRQAGQAQRIEVWTEAQDTIPDLRRLADEFGVPLVSSSGSLTLRARSELGRRVARDRLDGERPTVVLYAGDYDPPGMAIPKDIADGATWASRWAEYGALAVEGVGHDEAWKRAAQAWPNGRCLDPEMVTVRRIAVGRADLDDYQAVTGRVKESLVRVVPGRTGTGAYRQWWPEGEDRTLQLEAIPVDTLVGRIRGELEGMVDGQVLDRVLRREATERGAVLYRLGG